MRLPHVITGPKNLKIAIPHKQGEMRDDPLQNFIQFHGWFVLFSAGFSRSSSVSPEIKIHT
jgi:hypothetical protein